MATRISPVLARLPALALLLLSFFAPTVAQAQWQRCAGQDEMCRFDGQALVRYGAEGRYAFRVVRNRVPCDHHEFGDPAYGVVKHCEYTYDLSQRDANTSTARDGWTHCAAEGEYCRVNGMSRVRYGADNRYEYRNVSGGILCSVRLFGDPAYGVHKNCEYLAHGGGYGNVSHGSNWEYCGSEGGYCSFSGPGDVRYGVNGKFVVRRAINGLPCDVNTFGTDPAYGQNKQCFVRLRAR